MALTLILGIVLGQLQSRAKSSGSVDPVTRGVRSVVQPMASLMNSWADGFSAWSQGVASAGRLSAEVQRLKGQVSALRGYQESFASDQQEIARLRGLLGLPEPAGRVKVPARILNYNYFSSRLTISVGRRQGMMPSLAVVTPDGLLGLIESVDENSSDVLLITAASSRVMGIVNRELPAAGLVRGSRANLMTMDVPGSEPVKVEDVIITSGFSEWVPRGIPIGDVVEVIEQKELGLRRVSVFPRFKIGTGAEVAVYR